MNLRDIRKNVVRGTKVTIRDTTDDAGLRGKTMFVASHGLVNCKQDGRCAADAKCNGYAVFLSDENRAEVEVEGGWRKGTTKLCLSHLTLEDEPLTRVKAGDDERQTADDNEVEDEDDGEVEVTWERLAEVAQEAQAKAGKRGAAAVAELVRLSRKLKAQDELQTKRMVEVQSELLKIQAQALEVVMEQHSPKQVDEKRAEEPVAPFGFHVEGEESPAQQEDPAEVE